MYGKKPLQYCKVINLQIVKKKKIQAYLLKKRERNTPAPLPSHIKTIYINLWARNRYCRIANMMQLKINASNVKGVSGLSWKFSQIDVRSTEKKKGVTSFNDTYKQHFRVGFWTMTPVLSKPLLFLHIFYQVSALGWGWRVVRGNRRDSIYLEGH